MKNFFQKVWQFKNKYYLCSPFRSQNLSGIKKKKVINNWERFDSITRVLETQTL
jgi:hypothetical protein